jgi:hypothetical protein
VPGSDQSDVSAFKDGTKCDQRSSARVYAESQVVNFVLNKPLDANLSFFLSARGDYELQNVSLALQGGDAASATSTCLQPSWLKVAPMMHTFSLSTAQNQMSVVGTAVAKGSSVHCADGAVLSTTVRVQYGAAGATGSPNASQTLTLLGTVAALPSCQHSRSAASTSLDGMTVLAHDHELAIELVAVDVDGLPVTSTRVSFRVLVGYADDERPIETDTIRNAENGSMYASTVPRRLHSRAGRLRVRVTLHEAWDGQAHVPECEVLTKEVTVQCAAQYVPGAKNECTPAADRGSICSRAKPRVVMGLNSTPIDLTQPLEVNSVIEAGLDESDRGASSQYNLSLIATESTKTSLLSTGIALRRPGEHKLQVTSNGRDVCTMLSGNPFNVRCSDGEAEVEGRCIERPSCDTTTQLEIDGRCVYPVATGAFTLDELRADILKPADGVDVPSARSYTLKVTPADRFNLLWRPVDDRLQATWLRISESNRSEAGNVVSVEVMIDPTGLSDSSRLIETITFSSAKATAVGTSNDAPVGVTMTQLKIDSAVIAVPSLTKSAMRLLVDKSEVDPRAPVGLASGVKAQLEVDAVDEDGLAVRRGDRTLDFIVSGLQSREGIMSFVDSFVG